MKRLQLSMQKVKAIFISHEHGDHIKGVEVIAHKYRLPVYITAGTLHHSRLKLNESLIYPFQAYTPVQVGGLTIHPFPKFHDASDPHSFIIEGNGVKVGVFTDIGTPCLHLIDHFTQCHAAYLEANYDEQMLAEGRYPQHLKNRISGNEGHLSNRQALDLFVAHRPVFMSHIFLAHLSKDNNDPQRVLDLFKAHAGNTCIVVASRYSESAVYTICNTPHKPALKKKERLSHSLQTSLF